MKSSTLAYRNGMRGQLRAQSYVRITFGNTNVEAAEDGVWDSDDAADYSDTSTLDAEFYYYEDTVATLELNRWALDGKSVTLKDATEAYDGYVSDSVSDENGRYDVSPVLCRDFSAEHAIQGLTITFDSRADEWPLELIVRFYLGGNLVNFSTVQPTGQELKVRSNAAEIDQIQIEFTQMLPYRAARIESIIFGFEETFTNDDFEEVIQSTDVDPLSRRLPTEKLTFSIFDYGHRYDPDNPQGEYVYIEQNSPIYIQYGYTVPSGNVEWLKADRYLLDGKPTVESSIATFSATGMIGRMNDLYYKSKVGEKNFYDMAVEVLQDAGLKPTVKGKDPWEIDKSLKTMYTTAVLPIDTHMNCLQMIAHACRCKLFTDDDNIVHIEPFSVTVAGQYSGQYDDNGHLWYSDWDSVEESTLFTNTYATLELNRWELGGFSQIIPDEYETDGRGYVSELTANSSGSFTESNQFWDSRFHIDDNGHLILSDVDEQNNGFYLSEDGHLMYDGLYSEALRREEDNHVYADSTEQIPPYFEKTFDSGHDLQIIGLRFGGAPFDMPFEIRVEYYHDDILIDYQNVDNITDEEIIINNPSATNCTRFVVTYLSGFPYSRGRVSYIYFRENDFAINFDTIYHDTQSVTKIEKLKAVSVAKYSYVTEMTGGGSGLPDAEDYYFGDDT